MRRKILLVSATLLEIAPILARLGHAMPPGDTLGTPGTRIRTAACDVLITGVGQLQCAVHLMDALSEAPCDLVVHAGIAGSFDEALGKRSVVLVEEERLADLGAESGDTFVDLADMGLLPDTHAPFVGGWLRASRAWVPPGVERPFVRSVTVNRVLADPRSIAWVRTRYAPRIVNMEGAALFHACLVRKVPFVALRAISDIVGVTDRASWDVRGAVEALAEAVWPCLETAR